MGNVKSVQVGADILLHNQLELIEGKSVGLITNHSALLSTSEHLVDALVKRGGFKLQALFGPEHGIRGKAPDRKSIGHAVDPQTGIPIYSLFGKTTKPTRTMLKGIDVLVFDIQDVGARFYTYSTTLTLTMEAAAEKGIPYVVLDRPNPIGGCLVEGPMLDKNLRSFVGWLPLPVVHGLTMGELAAMISGEGWLRNRRASDLRVVKMKGWRRSWAFDRTELRWVNPSPSIRSLQTALIYPGTCFIEGTNVSEGRGTEHPFEQMGAPWIGGIELCSKLRSFHLPGVKFTPTAFTPLSTRAVTTDSKFEGIRCEGVFIKVTDRKRFRPVKTGVCLLHALQDLYPDQLTLKNRRLDELIGTRSVRRAITKGIHPIEIADTWKTENEEFLLKRRKYLLYR
ncbi:MAG: DUF1343 domain-containing protein [Ignavibacteriales bacterium]|nr:DUF1343 domain-containing protein [Ignavibacteriales bacterium]